MKTTIKHNNEPTVPEGLTYDEMSKKIGIYKLINVFSDNLTKCRFVVPSLGGPVFYTNPSVNHLMLTDKSVWNEQTLFVPVKEEINITFSTL